MTGGQCGEKMHPNSTSSRIAPQGHVMQGSLDLKGLLLRDPGAAAGVEAAAGPGNPGMRK